MKKILYGPVAVSLMALAFAGCDEYLDRLPDDRAEVNTVEKITNLLVSAYPTHSSVAILEQSSDNVTDNGTTYVAQPWQDQIYRFTTDESESNDDPRSLWNSYYACVATTNEVLQDIEIVNMPDKLRGQTAEALLCRAFNMFQLANTFCMAYNPERADGENAYLGLPYPKKVEDKVNPQYERGTLGELYRNIDADIEAALKLLDDSHLKAPKYHFNSRAAYAFAARFNLFYMKWDKAVEYATKAIGEDPTKLLRNWAEYSVLAGVDDISNRYLQSNETANLMLLNAYSIAGRLLWSGSYSRFAHNMNVISYETCWAKSPFCPTGQSSSNNCLYWAGMQYGNSQTVRFPKLEEQFEYTDKVAGIGYPHIVDAVFTVEETMLVRAEANIHLKNYEAAITDFNRWTLSHCSAKGGGAKRPTFTVQLVNDFFEGGQTELYNYAGMDYSVVVPESWREVTIRKKFNPQGFTIEEGTQENMLQIVLFMRRLETIHQGMRFQDVKRYGIEFSHLLAGEDPVVFKAGDLRGAIQIPTDVIIAGITENPR